jgi:aubergine-like protein
MLEKGVLLNVDIVHKVLRTDTVLDLIMEIKNRGSRGDPRDEIKKTLIGTTILTTYNKRTYKVDDIDFEKSPKDTFNQDDGSLVSYSEYFKNKYGREIEDIN